MSHPVHVLCVDDEPRVVQGLKLHLEMHYRVSTATGGAEALRMVEADPPAAIISDLRMPEMDGTVFLSRARDRSPEAVRILLTGQADIDAAIAAVNHAQIFRLLTKPCRPSLLLNALKAATEEHQSLVAARTTLEQTVRRSLELLVEVLALVHPVAFGRTARITQYAVGLIQAAGLGPSWQTEVAARLSQIGLAALPADVLDKRQRCQPLTREETEMLDRLPLLVDKALQKIPRFEGVAAILRNEAQRYDGAGAPGRPQGEAIPLGARALILALDYEDLERDGLPPAEALAKMRQREGRYDPTLLTTLAAVIGALEQQQPQELPLRQLAPGMVLARDLVTGGGALLAARGQQVTELVAERLRNLPPGEVAEPVQVFVQDAEAAPDRARYGAA
jgi:response regulator RpfG family c-di-GMP phosphodiesterase